MNSNTIETTIELSSTCAKMARLISACSDNRIVDCTLKDDHRTLVIDLSSASPEYGHISVPILANLDLTAEENDLLEVLAKSIKNYANEKFTAEDFPSHDTQTPNRILHKQIQHALLRGAETAEMICPKTTVNFASKEETIEIYLDPKKHPIAYGKKLTELMLSGFTFFEAVNYLNHTPITLEIYYEPFQGLFGVESEWIDNNSTDVKSPFTGETIPYYGDDQNNPSNSDTKS